MNWEPIPGAENARLFAHIIKPCVSCSNSYLLDAPDVILVIDPGNGQAQADVLYEQISALQSARPRPVHMVLGHAHVDHVWNAPGLAERTGARIFCHPDTVQVLTRRDPEASLAAFIGCVLPEFRSMEELAFTPRAGREEARLPLGGREGMTILHTPGHSPDSLCLQVGRLLFVGDLLFAANPGIAGIPRWHKGDLIRSLERILAVLRSGGIEIVHLSHGPALPAEQAASLCEQGLRKARSLPDLITMDAARRDQLAEYSCAALEEAGRLFTLIAGRRLRLAHWLEQLDEADLARNIAGRLDDMKIEELIEDFTSLQNHARAVGVERSNVLLRALRVVDRLNRLFDPHHVAGLMDATLPRRVQRLLTDYINSVYGVRYDSTVSCDLATTLQEVASELMESSCHDESGFDQADTPEAFQVELIRRLALVPLFKGAAFSNEVPDGLRIKLDSDLLKDMIVTLLEPLAASGARHFAFTSVQEPGFSRVMLRMAVPSVSMASASPAGIDYWRRTLQFAGGDVCAPNGFTREIVLPAE